MERLRRFLSRPVSVAAVGEFAIVMLIPYLLIGGAWSVWHYDTVTEWQQQWSKVAPAGGDVLGLGFTTALWPAMLLLPSSCEVGG